MNLVAAPPTWNEGTERLRSCVFAYDRRNFVIPEIGVLVAAYVFTRMLELSSSDSAGMPVRVLAVITMIVAAVVAADLVIRGGELARMFQ